jgi:hypothetical protein
VRIRSKKQSRKTWKICSPARKEACWNLWKRRVSLLKIWMLLKISHAGLVPVAHTYNPSYLKGWTRIFVRGQPGQKISKTLSHEIAGYSGMDLLSQATPETEVRMIMVPG